MNLELQPQPQYEPPPQNWRQQEATVDGGTEHYVKCAYCGARVPPDSTKEGHKIDCPVVTGRVKWIRPEEQTQDKRGQVVEQKLDPKEALLQRAAEMKAQREKEAKEIVEARRELLFKEIEDKAGIFIQHHSWGRPGTKDYLKRRAASKGRASGNDNLADIGLNLTNTGADGLKIWLFDERKHFFNGVKIRDVRDNEAIIGGPLFGESKPIIETVKPEVTTGWGPFKKVIPAEKRRRYDTERKKIGEIVFNAEQKDKDAYLIRLSVPIKGNGEVSMHVSVVIDKDLYDKIKAEVEKNPNFIGPFLESLFPEIIKANPMVNKDHKVETVFFDESDLSKPDKNKFQVREYQPEVEK